MNEKTLAHDESVRRQRLALEWFERSLEQPEAEREAWLNANCPDSDIRDRVVRLQAADIGAGDFLDSPHEFVARGAVPLGSRIGQYRIDRLIAEGGMGSVYLAHRDDGVYQQQVAIKFLHPLLRDAEANRRFAAERQILAQLQHPNIAQMFDAGSAEDGAAYVVMEYVDGVRITEYCHQHRVGLRQRLELFRQVCSAVAAAHRALIVHRDLKPANILVTGDGRPMLLDFGIAKILESENDGKERVTTLMALTPAYASPEQILGQPITTSSDIYSLGVLLYELLCGTRPYELDRLTPGQAEQMVCNTVPPMPSQVAMRKDAQAPFPSAPRLLRGDLDVITMKALRKEPERRYGSAQELSEDVHRYLRGLPIQARADSLRYRIAKFTQRNRWGVVAAAVILLSLIGGILTTSWQAHRAQQQAVRAEAQQARAEHINEFFKKVLMSPSSQWLSSLGKGADVSMAEVLDVASQRADTELAQYPDVQADVLDTLSQAFQGMGMYDKAQDSAARALQVAKQRLPANDRLRVTSHYRLAQALHLKNEFARSEQEYLRAIALAKNALPAGDEMTALMHNDLAVLYSAHGRFEDAQRELTVALALQRERMQGKPYPAIAIGLGNIGFIDLSQGDLDAALSRFNESLGVFARLPDREYSEVAGIISNRSMVYSIRGEFAHAQADAAKAVEIAARKLGRSHPRYARILLRHAETMLDIGKMDDVDATLTQAEKIMKQRLVAGHRSWATLAIVRARWNMQQAHFELAAKSLLDASQILKSQPETAPGTRPDRDHGRVLALLGEVRLAQDKPEQAAELLQQGVNIETALYGPDVFEVRQFRDALTRSRDALKAQGGHQAR